MNWLKPRDKFHDLRRAPITHEQQEFLRELFVLMTLNAWRSPKNVCLGGYVLVSLPLIHVIWILPFKDLCSQVQKITLQRNFRINSALKTFCTLKYISTIGDRETGGRTQDFGKSRHDKVFVWILSPRSRSGRVYEDDVNISKYKESKQQNVNTIYNFKAKRNEITTRSTKVGQSREITLSKDTIIAQSQFYQICEFYPIICWGRRWK